MALSVAAGSIAGFTASKITAGSDSDKKENLITYQSNGEQVPAYFTASSDGGGVMLPDFTTAAETGVESVVYIENIRKITLQGGGYGGIDPFEFFFGPSERSQRERNQEREPQTREQKSGGSGVILSEDGYIVSNNHVVEGATELTVTLHDGTVHKAKLIGTDPATDLSLLKIEANGLRPMPLGDSENLRLGEWVLAIGNPYGLRSTVTAGIVSAKGRTLGLGGQSQIGIESFIQTDAAVNQGNSGGALMTIDGRLVGINTVIQSPTGTFAGYSFAVPSSIVSKVVNDLKSYGVVQRAMLGILFNEITPAWTEQIGAEKGIKETSGIYIAEVVKDGAAEAAGIKEGDVLTHLNGKAVTKSSEVQETIAKLSPNDKINVTVKRDGKVKHFEVTLRNRAGRTDLISKEDVNLTQELGATFREVTDKQKKDLKIKGGIQVTSITDRDGLLARSKVRQGFIITEINDKPIRNISDLNRITEKVESIDGIYPDGRVVSYQVIRE